MGASAASKCAYIEETAPVSSSGPSAQSGASTNAFVLSMNLWEATYTLASGLPIYCQDCRSIFNSYSKRELKEGTTQTHLWTCEFCGFSNEFNANPESLPTQDNVTYILEAAPNAEETKEPIRTEALSSDDSTVIFCLDISGSMDEPAGNVSKLQCVKRAILGQIKEMKAITPNSKLVLTTFGQQVTVFKNGRTVKTLKNANKVSFTDCLQFAYSLEEYYINNTVENSATVISDVVMNISTRGSTALGPGLSVSVGIAERGKPGSKVIICTDGEANIGIGSVNNAQTATTFYEEVGNYARERGIVVNVVAIEGAECKLTCLSSLAEFTEGTLAKVNPHNLGADFAEILADRVVAFQAIATVTLHRALKFRNENLEDLQYNGSRLIRNVGNLPLSSSFSFEYTRKSTEELHESEVDISSLTSIPFQIVIEYRTTNGARCLRVISQSLAVTTSQQEAEQQANFEALSANYALRGAKFAQECKFEEWQSEEQNYRQLLARNVKNEKHRKDFESLNAMADSLNHEIRVQQRTEANMGINILQAPQKSKMARKAVMRDALSSKISSLKKQKF